MNTVGLARNLLDRSLRSILSVIQSLLSTRPSTRYFPYLYKHALSASVYVLIIYRDRSSLTLLAIYRLVRCDELPNRVERTTRSWGGGILSSHSHSNASVLNNSSNPRLLISSNKAVAIFICVSNVAFLAVNSGSCVIAVFKCAAFVERSS